MLFCGWLGFYSLMLIVKINKNLLCLINQIRSSEKAKVFSYQELAQITFGNYLRQFVNIVFFFANWGTAIAYLVLVSPLIKSAFFSFKPRFHN